MNLMEEITQSEKNLKQRNGKERIQLWNDYFKELLVKPPIHTSNDGSTLTIQNELAIK